MPCASTYANGLVVVSTVFAGCFLASARAHAESPNDILVVVNKSVPHDTMTADEVRAIFLKKRIASPGGDKIAPFHAEGGTSLRKRFDALVLGMAYEDEQRYWQDQNVKHSTTAPREVPTFKYERLRKVFYERGAISYVLRKDYLLGVVKIVLVIPDNGQ